MEVKEAIKLSALEAHLVLYCKGHYDPKDDNDDNVSLTEGMARLQAVFCGFNHDESSIRMEFVADRLWKILKKCCEPWKMEHIQYEIHKRLSGDFIIPKDLTAIEKLIWIYRSEISCLSVKEKDEKTGEWHPIISLPENTEEDKKFLTEIVKGKYPEDWFKKIGEISKKIED
jgi:hypothetical protein